MKKSNIALILFVSIFLTLSCEINENKIEEPCIVENLSTLGTEKCETAFAYTCPAGLMPLEVFCFSKWHFSNWGWVVKFTVTEERYFLNLIAAAGRCDNIKGIDAGTVRLKPTETGYHVYYELEYTNYSLKEVHFFIGTEPFPRDKDGNYTDSPGKYFYVDNDVSDPKKYWFLVDIDKEIGDELYVIAHAVVCKDEDM